GGEAIRAPAPAVPLREPVNELGEPGTEPTLAEVAAREPAAEGVDGRRPVGAQVARDRERGRDVGLRHTLPCRAGVLGQLERDSRALARPMAQVALPRERLQKRPPPRAQRLSEMPQTTPRADRRDELL